jgi:hypothetical protein
VVPGDVICLVHGEAGRYYRRPGVAYVPIRDAPIGTRVLIWRAAQQTPLIHAFARAAEDSRPPAGETS